jgi:putative mycofactocin binding protein MftB
MTEAPSVLDRPLELAAQVSVRPERFGALLYHFGTRRLSFLKDPRLLAVVQHLSEAATARDACAASGVDPASLRSFDVALRRLLDTGMLQERPA